MAATAARSVVNTLAGPTLRYTPSTPTTLGSIAVLLMTDPSGARLPHGNVTVEVRPRACACSGLMITSSGSTPSRSFNKARNACRYGDLAPPVTNVVDPGVLSGVTACSGSTDPNAPRFRSGPNAYMIRASLGHPDPASLGDWNLTAGYKYLQGDAVLDAYTDSDFHLGGTNARGYFLMATVGLAPNTNVQFRWFSSNEVSGPPLSIDVGQVDLNVKF